MSIEIVVVLAAIVFILFLSGLARYGKRCRTLKGEWVKSKAEKMIADYFYKHGIAYQYEKRALGIKPDFYLPQLGLYVEYWGLANGSGRYRKQMRWKMAQYHKHGVRFISLYPEDLRHLEWSMKKKLQVE